MNRNTVVAGVIVIGLIIVGLIKGGRPEQYQTQTEAVDVDQFTPQIIPQLTPTSQPAATQPGSVAKEYPSRKAMIDGVMASQSDAGGSFTIFADTPQDDGSSLTGFAIESRFQYKTRYLVFRGRDGGFHLVDDFENEGALTVNSVSEINGQMVFFTVDGKTPLIRTPK